MTRVGAHLPSRQPLLEAEQRGADLIQMFLSNPQSWRKPEPRADANELRASPMPIYVHAPYLVNVCADNNRVRIPSRRILQETCDAAAEIGAEAVIVHGGHVTGEGGTELGIIRWRKALDELDSDVPVWIENTAGGEFAVARRVEWVAKLWEEIGGYSVGFVLDTCHAWAGGESLEGLVDRVVEATGHIDLVQVNDSKDPFDSRRDRHQNLGSGQIPKEQLTAVIVDARAPVAVETPGGVEEQTADIRWVREALGENSE